MEMEIFHVEEVFFSLASVVRVSIMKRYTPRYFSQKQEKWTASMDKKARAAEIHDLGYGCAQSVLCAFNEDHGLDEETALRISTGFGSGMGRLCEICGALAGGCMVIGLEHGKVISDGSKYGTETETTYRLTAEMAHRFQARNGAIRCRELLGLDLSQEHDRQRALEEGIFANQCGMYIQDVVEIVEDLLREERERFEVSGV